MINKFSIEMKQKYNTLLQTIKATFILTLILISSYFLLGTIPQFFDLTPSAIYTKLVFAISALLSIPVIIFFSKKWNIRIKTFFMKLPKWHEVLILTIITGACYIATLIVIDSVEDIGKIYNGKINSIFFKIIPFKFANYIGLIHFTIIAPIIEEIFFRGLILTLLLRQFSVFKSIVISSLLFSIGHLKFDDFILLFFSGIVFALIFYKTGSLYLSILAHSLNNLIGNFIDIEKVSIDNVSGSYFVLIIVGLIFIMVTAYILFLKQREL